MGKINTEDTDMIISMAMDMMNNPRIDNGKLVRACIFAACIIAITHKVELGKMTEILGILYRRISLTIGVESMFPPAES